MMPPFKKYTEHYYTDLDGTLREIDTPDFLVEGCKSATLFSKGRLYFRMSVPKYQTLINDGLLSVSDNGGRPYHKMYFHACNRGDEVSRGDVWETRTEYRITNGEEIGK